MKALGLCLMALDWAGEGSAGHGRQAGAGSLETSFGGLLGLEKDCISVQRLLWGWGLLKLIQKLWLEIEDADYFLGHLYSMIPFPSYLFLPCLL